MKSRLLIGLSAVALMVLIVVQYVFITETYRTKQALFDSKFGVSETSLKPSWMR